MMQDMNTTEDFPAVHGEYLQKIIRAYAQRICRVWDRYRDRVHEFNAQLESDAITLEEYYDSLEALNHEIIPILARLMIEQYFNTAEENIFDRAMMLDENVELEDVSIISTGEIAADVPAPEESKPITLLYDGFLFPIGEEAPARRSLTALVRDQGEVEKVNLKLSRGRELLGIDEVTLGKKCYDGLCRRTHFFSH